jgi:hypothetical protein
VLPLAPEFADAGTHQFRESTMRQEESSAVTRGKIEPLMQGNHTSIPGFVYNFLQLRGFGNTSLPGYPESILQSALE